MQMDPPPTDQGWKTRMLRKFGLRTKKAEMPAVFTMGATNLVETLDAALLRAGPLRLEDPGRASELRRPDGGAGVLPGEGEDGPESADGADRDRDDHARGPGYSRSR